MADKFRDALPEDIRSHAALEKIENIGDLGRSFVSAQQMIGKDPSSLIEIPAADNPEAMRAALGRLGAPTEVGGYEIAAPEGAPEWLAPDQPMSKGFLDVAVKTGLLPHQTKDVYNWFSGQMTEAAIVQEAQSLETSEANIRKLEGEFGGAFDKKVALANHGIDKLGGEELRKVLNDANVGHEPSVIKAFAAVGAMIAEDSDGGGGGSSSFGTGMAPDEARSKGKALLVQASQSSDMAERRRLNDEAQKFFSMATPGNVPETL